jgi:hypothetical protein
LLPILGTNFSAPGRDVVKTFMYSQKGAHTHGYELTERFTAHHFTLSVRKEWTGELR